ncbi:GNAT family N-acetyltransferase [Cnuibacter sp. UC19_7]|uniref:GNAT family N-acetyltransferase n=1 Tax=Cnuibacter sp. UC19_7 TaxID=3350166 RepID=UPI003670B80D
MGTALRPMPDDALGVWRANAEAHYLAERIAAGDTPEYAAKRVAQSQEYFPGGRPAEGQLVFQVVERGEDGGDDTVVGALWIGLLDPDQPTAWWVLDVEIDEEHRGKGYGRAAMRLAEQEARARGGDRIGLNVFGPNTVARSLYDSLGYRVTATNMTKELR